jgi:hypothetical protein
LDQAKIRGDELLIASYAGYERFFSLIPPVT